MMSWIKKIFMDAAVGFYVAAWHLFIGVAKATHAVVDGIGAAWAWWFRAFGVSDVIDRPDSGTLATRAAAHFGFGTLAVLVVPTVLGYPQWYALPALGVLYAAWEVWQWAVDPARHKRRVARRWDGAVDWGAVVSGGGGAAAADAQLGLLTAVVGCSAAVLILVSAALMAPRGTP
jgi:hypothetical protein